MKHTLWLLALTAIGAACATTHASYTSADAPAQFDKLKTLAGRWESKPGTADPKETITYRVTSGGSVLMEDMFPGTPHEMITMYHLDHGALRLTHYCSAGNQPSMCAGEAASDGTLTFHCSGGPNIDCAHEGHMHQVVMRVIDRDHVKSVWTFYRDGKQAETKEIELVRVGDA